MANGKMARAFVAVGSNIDPAANVRRALELLALEARLVAVSTVYRTRPLGRPKQADYYNCVAEIETEIPPTDLKCGVLRRIEGALGRERGEDKFAARTIDMDLIAYDELEMETADLELPAPEIQCRPFVAVPLAELAPELTLPGLGVRAASLAATMSNADMEPLASYTEQVRRGLRHEHREGPAAS
jgi:2-amino-4-hydroxy-6-hydroxymethyldihydropteridine diphosphokinase